MGQRILDIAICGTSDPSTVIQNFTSRTAELLSAHPSVQTPRFTAAVPGQATSDSHHLVVQLDPTATHNPWVDTTAETSEDRDILVAERIVPWAYKWAVNRRAPRAMVPVQAHPDPTWATQASRLIGRLRNHITDPGLLRIDHIGSTSVPGLAAKDLVDIQVLAQTTEAAEHIAQQATAAGFSWVAGDWFGVDRDGTTYPELVVVDSDPGRPVNCNIRLASEPVGRDAILYRDWLRASEAARDRYAELKARLVTEQDQHVDSYSKQKEPFINDALAHAEDWAASAGWSL